jgi:hypothetical protein
MKKKPGKREIALAEITYDFAKNGKDTGPATNAYIDGKLSRAAYNKAAQLGLAQHKSGRVIP